MAEVQQDRRRYVLPEPEQGRRSVMASVAGLVVVLAAIAFLLQTSRRHASRPGVETAAATVEPPSAPPADPGVAVPAAAPAAAAAAQDEAEGPEGTMSAQKQSAI